MLQKVLWTALTAILTSVATGLALKLSTRLWERFAHAPPPRARIAGLLVQPPLRRRILARLNPA
jgi:hypothetical protein